MTRILVGLCALLSTIALGQRAAALSIAPPIDLGCDIALVLDDDVRVSRNADGTYTGQGGQCIAAVACRNQGSTFQQLVGNIYSCRSASASCKPFILLQAGDKVWKRSATMYKLQGSNVCYNRVQCAFGTTLTHISGDTWQCVASSGPNCLPFKTLVEGEKVWRRSSTMWKTRDGICYTRVTCKFGTELQHVSGDTHTCVATNTGGGFFGNGCLPFIVLADEVPVWRRASDMWKLRNGTCYQRVQCQFGAQITHVSGDTHVCRR